MFRRTRAADRRRADVVPGGSPAPRGEALLLGLIFAITTLAVIGAQAAELTFELRLENGRVPVNMRLVRVTQGDVVRLRWSADRPVVLHLHGYDIETRVAPGAVGEMTFTARATGRFPVHAHSAGARGGDEAHADAALLYVEVYPR